MEGMNSKLLILFFALFSSFAYAATEEQPIIRVGPDGQSLECPFPYEVEQVVEWGSSQGPPPITINDVNELFSQYIEDNYSGANSFILEYHLFVPNTLNFPSLGWVYMIEFIVFEGRAPIARNSDAKMLAITMNGTILEPECGTP